MSTAMKNNPTATTKQVDVQPFVLVFNIFKLLLNKHGATTMVYKELDKGNGIALQ